MTDSDRHILIFGGTTEGRLLTEFCVRRRIPAFVSVATAYGGALLDADGSVRVLTGRMDSEQMTSFLTAHAISLAVDATHPFAVEASRNITAACVAAGVKCCRVLRAGEEETSGILFDGIPAVVAYLNDHPEGNILLTTGSKELHLYRAVHHYAERCAARVLPAEGIVEKCVSLGFRRENIIAAKGPFTAEQNRAHIKGCNARFLVTKESGAAGGFAEKRKAAHDCGAAFLIIRRPVETGVSLEQAEKIIMTEYEATHESFQ